MLSVQYGVIKYNFKMNKNQPLFDNKYLLWIILVLPGIWSLRNYLVGKLNYNMIMHISGEFAGRFLIASLIATPLILMFPNSKVSKWLIRNRRFLGLAAFAYTLLHTIIYVFKYPFGQVIDEFSSIAILTGWIAFFIFIPLAITSTDAAIKKMGPSWKKLQRWVYLAAIMAFLHWALLGLQGEHKSIGGALFHFTPVLILQVYRVWKQKTQVS